MQSPPFRALITRYIRAAFGPKTTAASQRRSKRNALTPVAGQAYHPHNDRRCPGGQRCHCDCQYPQDDAYLAQLRAVGLSWPPKTEEALIGEAHLICYDLTWGWAPQQIADDIHSHLDARGVTLLDVGTMVDAAHSIYCPGNVCDAPSLCT